MLEELNWKEKYIYLLFREYRGKKFKNVDELYDTIGMSRKVATRTIHSLVDKEWILWSPRNPDRRFYVLLK